MDRNKFLSVSIMCYLIKNTSKSRDIKETNLQKAFKRYIPNLLTNNVNYEKMLVLMKLGYNKINKNVILFGVS